MRIIFLDIDGVLNSDQWYQTENCKSLKEPLKHFDPRCVELLNRLAKKTAANFVISSTWRIKYKFDELLKILNTVGLNINVIGYTPDLKNHGDFVVRGNEILKWCQDHELQLECNWKEYRDYAIIDDNTDFLTWQNENFFKTDRYIGLTPTLHRTIVKHFEKLKINTTKHKFL